jgi:hypothetical protein
MYTLVTIVLLVALANIFFTQTRYDGHDRQTAVEERVRSIDGFIKGLERDSQRASYIAGFRAFIAMEQHITSTGEPIADVDAVFKQIFINGTYSNTSYFIMENSSFNEYLARVQYEAGQQGIAFNATISNVTLWQSDPWNVQVDYTLAANVTDNRGTASWIIERRFTGSIPVADLRDPLFTSRTYGRIQRVIKPTNVSGFVDDAGNKNDTTELMLHFNNSYYAAAGRGPSMLMRFAGNLSDSEFGIESLVDADEFAAQSLPVNSTASVVDYRYFSGVKATACGIQNLPSRIKLAESDLEVYEVRSGAQQQLTYGACP